MRRLLILPALLLAAASWADVNFATPHSTTSYYSPCFPLYSTASDGAGTLTGMSGSDANFIIYAQIDNTATDIEYQTTADIETIATIGTYATPTADTDIRFGECGTPGTYQIQPRDSLLATSGAKQITFKLTDGVDTMADQIVYLDLNVADETDLRSWTQAEIEEYDGPTDAEMDARFDDVDSAFGAGVDVASIDGNTTSATQLALSAATIESGEAEGTPSTTSIQTDLAETDDDIYIGRVIIFTSGDARGEVTSITDYTGSTGTLTVTALANAPAAGDLFVIL